MRVEAAAAVGLERTRSVPVETEIGIDSEVARDTPIVVGVEVEIIANVSATLVTPSG